MVAMIGILGKKLGMTQVFRDDGSMIGVTVIEAGPCPILAVKVKNIQVAFDIVDDKRLRKPNLGLFKKVNVTARKYVRELRRDPAKEYKVGEELKADLFKPGDFVDITGISIGKRIQGGMKRWHSTGGRESHGSPSHRRMGSTGSSTTPSRVWKGHHQAGHMGAAQTTVQNLEVVKSDLENNILLVKGAIPGAKNSYVIVKKAKKKISIYERPSPAATATKGKAKGK